MNQILESDLPEYLLPFEKMIATGENMRNAMESLVTIGQVVLLKSQNPVEPPICVINTHLISKAHGEHVKLVHVLHMLHQAKQLLKSWEVDAQIIFVGDLNSSPNRDGRADGTPFHSLEGSPTSKHYIVERWQTRCRSLGMGSVQKIQLEEAQGNTISLSRLNCSTERHQRKLTLQNSERVQQKMTKIPLKAWSFKCPFIYILPLVCLSSQQCGNQCRLEDALLQLY